MPRALVVDDDAASLSGLSEIVESEGFEVETADSLAAARDSMGDEMPDLVLTDLILPDGKGIELFDDIEPEVAVILVTGKATVETAVEALRQGAYDYLTKPVDLARLKSLLARIKDTRELRAEVSALRAQLREMGRFGSMVGTSEAMQRVYDLLDRVAPTDATVFLVGESGTGKELAAETVHRLSPRRKGAYLPLNCGAISPNLIESELFGHEKGSFTGASRQHKGYFETCSGGTIFLDEITEMPAELQVKLLRVLETGRIIRVGGTSEIDVDARIVAATNRDPKEAVAENDLREDLYYRLRVFPIQLPPLRDRDGDVDLLTRYFLDALNEGQEKPKRISGDAIRLLRSHSWPGNVRELKNVVQRAYILADEEITPEFLPREIGGDASAEPTLSIRVGTSAEEAICRLAAATLDARKGDEQEAADALGISVEELQELLEELPSPGATAAD